MLTLTLMPKTIHFSGTVMIDMPVGVRAGASQRALVSPASDQTQGPLRGSLSPYLRIRVTTFTSMRFHLEEEKKKSSRTRNHHLVS